jgi:hypothetical protein
MIRVHEHFYQAGEEIKDKVETVAMNSRAFLEMKEA